MSAFSTVANYNRSSRQLRLEILEHRHPYTADFDFSLQTTSVLPDINGNGSEEIAVTRYDPVERVNHLIVLDPRSNLILSESSAIDTVWTVDLEPIVDSSGSIQVAWLLWSESRLATTIQVRDPNNGTRSVIIKAIGGDFRPIDLEVFVNANGKTQLAVLAHNAVRNSSRIQVLDLETGRRSALFTLDPTWKPIGFELIQNGNDDPQFFIYESKVFGTTVRSQIEVRSIDGGRIRATTTDDVSDEAIAKDPDARFMAKDGSVFLLSSPPSSNTYFIHQYNAELSTVSTFPFTDGKEATSLFVSSGENPSSGTIDVLLNDPITHATFTRHVILGDGSSTLLHQGNGFQTDQMAVLDPGSGGHPVAALLQSSTSSSTRSSLKSNRR